MKSNTYNPFKPREFSKAQVEQVIGPKSDARLAQKIKQENPNLYAALRRQAEVDGLAAPIPQPYSAWRMPKDRVFSDAEIIARSKYSEQDCRNIFCKSGVTGGVNNAGNLFKNDPQKYNEMRQAAVSYGLIPETQPAPIVHTDKPVRQEPEGFVLSDAIADKINLPRGTRVTTEQFAKITTILNEPVTSDETKE